MAQGGRLDHRTDGTGLKKIHSRTWRWRSSGEFWSPDGKTIWYDAAAGGGFLAGAYRVIRASGPGSTCSASNGRSTSTLRPTERCCARWRATPDRWSGLPTDSGFTFTARADPQRVPGTQLRAAGVLRANGGEHARHQYRLETTSFHAGRQWVVFRPYVRRRVSVRPWRWPGGSISESESTPEGFMR